MYVFTKFNKRHPVYPGDLLKVTRSYYHGEHQRIKIILSYKTIFVLGIEFLPSVEDTGAKLTYCYKGKIYQSEFSVLHDWFKSE